MTAPRHVSTEDVSPKSKFAIFCGCAIRNNLSGSNLITHRNDGTLVDTGATITPFERLEFVNIVAHLTEGIFTLISVKCFTCMDKDFVSRDTCDGASTGRSNKGTRIQCSGGFHPCSYERCFWTDERYSLTLVVRTHQCAVCILMLQKWNKRGGNPNDLLWRDTDVIHFFHRKRQDILSTTDG